MLQVHDSGARWRTLLEQSYANDISSLGKIWPDQRKLEVKFDDIQSWDPQFAEALLEHPKQILRHGSDALQALCREGGEDIDPMLRVICLPPDAKRNLRDVGSNDINQLISVEVIVTKVSSLKPRVYAGSFVCSTCGHIVEIGQMNELELVEPLECSEEHGGCGRRKSGGQTRFELLTENSILIDNQWMEIQELPENAPSGSQPARMQVLAEGDLAGSHTPGSRITANVIPFIRSEKRGGQKTPMFDTYLSLMSSEQQNTPLEEIEISEEDLVNIQEISEREDLFEIFTRSIAPSIFGTERLWLVKKSLVLQLFGGVPRTQSDNTRTRGDIHILLLGDPGVAKSQLLTFMGKISPRGKFTTGGGTTAAGLTAAAVRDSFNDGRFSLEAGALVLADMGLCAVDEFDKMSPDDRSAMNEAMEQQVININKGGISATMRTRCAILAASNPRSGKFRDFGQNHIDIDWTEVNLPPSLVSRFDIIWMIQDLKNMNQDTRIAQHIIESRRRGVPEQLVDMGIKIDPSILSDDKIIGKDNDDNEIFSVQMFRKYVAYAKRQVFPELDDAATKMLIEYYTKARNEYRDEDDKVIISARALEALIRLSEAHARMHLREVAGIVDAEQAIGMYKLWRYELMGDEYDELTIQTGDSTRKRSADRVVSGIVRNLCRELGECQTNDIYNTANEAGFDEDTVDRVLRALQQRGTFYSPTPDTWRLA